MSDKRAAALAIASQKKQQVALAKTERAITYLAENKFKITVRSVAKIAGVSVSFLYKYPEIIYRIHTLKEKQKYELLAVARRGTFLVSFVFTFFHGLGIVMHVEVDIHGSG